MEVVLDKVKKGMWVCEIDYRTYIFRWDEPKKGPSPWQHRTGILFLISHIHCENLKKNLNIGEARALIAVIEKKRFAW